MSARSIMVRNTYLKSTNISELATVPTTQAVSRTTAMAACTPGGAGGAMGSGPVELGVLPPPQTSTSQPDMVSEVI